MINNTVSELNDKIYNLIMRGHTHMLNEGVAVIDNNMVIKVRPSLINDLIEEREYFYKNTHLCRCELQGRNRVFSLNYNVKYEEEKLRVQLYKKNLIRLGYIEETNINDFTDLENYLEPTETDILRVNISLLNINNIIETGKIEDNYMYVIYKQNDLLCLKVFKTGEKINDISFYSNRLMFEDDKELEVYKIFLSNQCRIKFKDEKELRVELELYKTFLSNQNNNKILKKVDTGRINKLMGFELYDITTEYLFDLNISTILLVFIDTNLKERVMFLKDKGTKEELLFQIESYKDIFE